MQTFRMCASSAMMTSAPFSSMFATSFLPSSSCTSSMKHVKTHLSVMHLAGKKLLAIRTQCFQVVLKERRYEKH